MIYCNIVQGKLIVISFSIFVVQFSAGGGAGVETDGTHRGRQPLENV